MESERHLVEKKCVPTITKICNTKKTLVIKTVRLGADIINTLMAKYDNLKIIHLFRDPRPVSVSRIKVGWATLGSVNVGAARTNINKTKAISVSEIHDAWYRNAESEKDANFSWTSMLQKIPATEIGKVAQMYCYQVMRDISTLKGYKEKYPGRVYQMVFKKMANDPIGETEKVYQFVNEPLHRNVIHWLKSHTEGKVSSKTIAVKWQKEISHSTAIDIEKQCEPFF